MEIFTSRWKNPELQRLDCQPVSISRGDRRRPGFAYKKLWDLAPSKATFAMSDAYAARASYRAGLDEIGVELIQDPLQELADQSGLPLVLLCHEDVLGKGDGCHRRWFASWYEEQTGIEIPELEPGMIEESDELRQPRLL